jgi:hypothetical protein
MTQLQTIQGLLYDICNQYLFPRSKRFLQKFPQAVGKSLFKGIVEAFFMINYALAAKAVSFAINLRA